ncbi:MAG TPA: fructose-bisphosphate aldolase [Desulfobacteraceae bacterium]|nr:fructose-bisphosphate aldolase [Desulfobacteraceae bacterium]
MIGKQIRMERIMDRNTGRTVIVPMDHGVSVGPIAGITSMKDAVSEVVEGGANAVVVHKGIVSQGHRKGGTDVGLIIHLSAGTSLSNHPLDKTIVCSVEEALKMGADAVSVHVNVGNNHDSHMLRDLGETAHTASQWGVPLLAMIYPRGKRIKDEYDPEAVMHAARLGAELGADLVKVSYTGSKESFRKVVEGCHVPIVIAGGARMDNDWEVLSMVDDAIEAGAAGISIGRNVFQHPCPSLMVSALSAIVHDRMPVEQAAELLKKTPARKAA